MKTERKGSVSESLDLKGDKKWFKLIVGHEMLGELRKIIKTKVCPSFKHKSQNSLYGNMLFQQIKTMFHTVLLLLSRLLMNEKPAYDKLKYFLLLPSMIF